MEPIVIMVDPSRLEEIRVTLLDQDNTIEHRLTNKYESFRVRFSGGMIIGYTSGKIVINSQNAAELLRRVIESMEFDDKELDIVIGSDEAGKGEWLGPLTVSAVALNYEQSKTLRAVGVIDSKELSLTRIGELAFEIESNNLASHTVMISPETFNQRLQEFHNEGRNLNDLLAWAHAKAISEVYSELNLSESSFSVRVVIDEFAREKTENRLGSAIDLSSIELIQKHQAEDVIAVAAASIIAKDAREDWIDKASLRLGIELASLTPEDAITRDNKNEFAKGIYLKD
ncbi:MAG: hypothetical protein ACXADL_15540 [Candidatus Thorarchaeota archaeon]|jgi:ribonuclease HIII